MAALSPADPGGTDRIDAVVDCCGPTDLVARLARTDLERAIVRLPPDACCLRTGIETPDLDRARQAGPLCQQLDQSRRPHETLVAGCESHLLVLGGAGHGDPRYQSPWILDATAAFLKQHLAA
ncbi:alpha/beta hydrolase family protein [Amycolatopsis rubida]|uniref:Uncharacterized protein n=1 Tax=Amycolatopsis rubida TaxID=112413 RepID=A0A1I5SMX0_9PSEU|nr:hypothetical protein [Amycolatopsis rubida]SFP72092.1 hypothetical protein SAMN05421854_106385 [Amycolatopsis rubida]